MRGRFPRRQEASAPSRAVPKVFVLTLHLNRAERQNRATHGVGGYAGRGRIAVARWDGETTILEVVMQTNCLFKRAALTLLVVVVATAVAPAQNNPTVRFVNYSGEDRDGQASRTNGRLRRYPERRISDRWRSGRGVHHRHAVREARRLLVSAGEQFLVSESAYSVDRISITLHKVPNGNYRTQKAKSSEF